ncbi:MAG: YeeE/YedE family protein [Burkholderiales bacterium]|jgi:uncharacterized membrane protein YedE/YeeE
MTLDWTAFTPGPAFAGGLLIGLAAAMLVLLTGRVAGISGIVGGLLGRRHGPAGWRLAFVAGLLLSPLAWSAFAPLPLPRIDADWATLVAAGLLVGVGTRYGAGCTSGHGVCGLSRLSGRSVVATACFMAAGFATVFVVRHLVAG